MSDGLWPHFKPLWIELQKVTPAPVLAGGYGLFLKQAWLTAKARQETPERIVIPMDAWRDTDNRATKDFDVIIGVQLIADRKSQDRILSILFRHGFEVDKANKYWKHSKKDEQGRDVILELHSPPPSRKRHDVEVGNRRVKNPNHFIPRIDSHLNPEAVGFDVSSFSFPLDETEITIANPVTYCVMKMQAMNDRFTKGTKQEDREAGNEYREAAKKHARDVARIVAMTTLSERDSAKRVCSILKSEGGYRSAQRIFKESFQDRTGFGHATTVTHWRDRDHETLIETLAEWFG